MGKEIKKYKNLVDKYLNKINQKQSISANEILNDFINIDEIPDYKKIKSFVCQLEAIGCFVSDKNLLTGSYTKQIQNKTIETKSKPPIPKPIPKTTAIKYNTLAQKYLFKVNQNEVIDVFEIIDDYLEIDTELDFSQLSKLVETLEKIGGKVINKGVLKNSSIISNPVEDGLTTYDKRFSGSDQETDDDNNVVDTYVGDVIKLLMQDIKLYPVLNPKEEHELAKKCAHGDQEAKDKLIVSNIRLVISYAKKFGNPGILSMEDLVSEGINGLLKATSRFDYRKGYKFSTYATWWIYQSITRAIADTARLIRLPVHLVEKCNKIKRTIYLLTFENQREPSIQELAEELDINREILDQYLFYIENYMSGHLSLDAPVNEEGDTSLVELVAATDNVEVEEEVLDKIMGEEIDNILQTLTERQSNVLAMRFGLHGKAPMTLEQVGYQYGLTRERIRQIESKALKRLRHPSKNKSLVGWLND